MLKKYIVQQLQKQRGDNIEGFYSRPRAIRELDEQIKQKLENVCNNNYEILVGDIECY